MSQPNGDLPQPRHEAPDRSADIEHFLANDPGFQEVEQLKAAVRWAYEECLLPASFFTALCREADEGNEHAARLLAVLEEGS